MGNAKWFAVSLFRIFANMHHEDIWIMCIDHVTSSNDVQLNAGVITGPTRMRRVMC